MNSKLPENLNRLYDQTIKYLDIAVLSRQTIDLLKNDSIFQKIFVECVGIVNYIENKYDIANGHTSRYAQAYYAICGQNLMINDDPKLYANEIEQEEKVNYLNTYLINRINMDFNQLEDSLKTVNIDGTDETVKVDSIDKGENSETTNTFHSTGQRMSDEEVLHKSGYTVHDVADQLINSQATIILNRNVASGKVFIYKSKPKVIFWIKMLTFVCFIILMLLSIASYGILMSQNGKLVYNTASSGETEKLQPFGFVNPLPYIQIILVIMIALISLSLVKNIKNDNARYFMPWGWLSLYCIFLLVVTMTAGETQLLLFRWDYFLTTFKKWTNVTSSGDWTESSKAVIQILEVWKILQYCIYALIGTIAICVMIAAIFNPKKDIERMQQLHQQYVTQIRNGEIDTSDITGSNNPFGGISARMI